MILILFFLLLFWTKILEYLFTIDLENMEKLKFQDLEMDGSYCFTISSYIKLTVQTQRENN